MSENRPGMGSRVWTRATLLTRLTIAASDAAAGTAELSVQRDGEGVSKAVLGTPVPLDPGKHKVIASAPGYKPWEQTVELKDAGATVTVIPEEFTERPLKLRRLVDLLIGAVIKRLTSGRADGVAVLAEGLIEIVDPQDLRGLEQVERDEHGHLRLSEVDLGDVLRREVTKGLKDLGLSVPIVSKNVGYELRCADPIPYDIEYTRDLGYCAAQYVLDGGTAAMVSIQDGRFTPIPFKQMLDPVTGRAKVRMVDIGSQSYHTARQYMIRLTEEDFNDQDRLGRYAALAGISPETFRARFAGLVEPAARHQ
jgi:6-phosphofructokinase 1